MCDPLTIAGLAVTAVSAVGQAEAASSQRREISRREDEARRLAAAERVRQDALRRRAEEKISEGLNSQKQQSQEKFLENEQSRLEEVLTDGKSEKQTTQASIADVALTSQDRGSKRFKNDLAAKISEASAEARKRIGALARVQSFGNLGAAQGQISGDLNTELGLINNFRRGGLATLGAGQRELARAPLPQSNGLAETIGGLGSLSLAAGQAGLGDDLASIFAGPQVTDAARRRAQSLG